MESNYNLDTHFYIFDFKNASPIFKKIQSFKKLGEGWHYGEGRKFSAEVIKCAEDLAGYLSNNLFNKLNAFPGLDGEIMIKTYFPTSAIEITINSDLKANFMVETRAGEQLFESDTVSIADLKRQILSHRYTNFEWNSLEYSPSLITTLPTNDLLVSLSKTPQKPSGVVYRSYVKNAQKAIPLQFVSTSEKSTANSQILQSTGSFNLVYCPPVTI